jgi:hypothetical protein
LAPRQEVQETHTVKTQNIRDERRFKVNSIRNWLKSDPEMEVSEMKTKFLAMGVDLEVHSINHSLKEALLLINREVIFGPDAQRMFPPRKSSKKVRVASKSSLSF